MSLLKGTRMRHMMVMREMKEDCNFPQSVLQSLCTGEPIEIQIKNKGTVRHPRECGLIENPHFSKASSAANCVSANGALISPQL